MNTDPQLQSAIDLVRSRIDRTPTTAIILGSGLGGLADRINGPTTIPYHDIPGFRSSSAQGHRGELIFGTLGSRLVVAMSGRLHRYEGWTNDEIAFPVRLMSLLGATQLVVSNAAGGVNPKLRVGDIVVIRDHLNWMGGIRSRSRSVVAPSPLRNGAIYDERLSAIAMRVAIDEQFAAYSGTYLGTLGPSYETRSEYRMMRRIGADVVGMSTVPEVLAGSVEKMRILGLSMVANVAHPDLAVAASHAEVLEAGQSAATKMEAIVRAVLRAG